MNGHAYEVIGVAPPGFRGAVWPTYASAFWIPSMMAQDIFGSRNDILTERRYGIFQTVGRRRADRSVEVLQARLGPLDATLRSFREPPYFVDTGAPWRVAVMPGNALRLWPEYRAQVTRVVLILGLMAACALTIGCANLGTLLMARWMYRGQELVIRRALGARTRDLARRLGADVVVLVVGGAIGGAWLIINVSPWVPLLPLGVPYELDLVPDYRVAFLGLVLTLVAAALLGAIPIWRTLRARDGLGSRERTVTTGGLRTMQGLVVAQIALTLSLLVGCGVLLRSARAVQAVDPGFRAAQGLTAQLAFTAEADLAAKVSMVSTLVDRLREDSRVAAASVSAGRVLSFLATRSVLLQASLITPPDEPVTARLNRVTADYFTSYGIPLVAGRDFSAGEARTGDVVIISRSLAERAWPSGTAIGRRVRLEDEDTPRRIIGVVAETAGRDVRVTSTPTVYLPWAQRPEGWAYVNLNMRTEGGMGLPVLRAHLSELDPTLAVSDVQTYRTLRQAASRDARVLAALSAALAALAVVLSVVGLHGLMGYVISRRQRELGIRAALGASPRANAGFVVRRAGGLTAVGVLVGIPASLVATRGLGSLLYTVHPNDPGVLVIVTVTIAAIALVGSWPHARRAAQVDPAVVLRLE